MLPSEREWNEGTTFKAVYHLHHCPQNNVWLVGNIYYVSKEKKVEHPWRFLGNWYLWNNVYVDLLD